MSITDATLVMKRVDAEPVTPEEVLARVYQSLAEKGYNPTHQLVGYLLSGDPTYITSYNNARSVIRLVQRDELIEELVSEYIRTKGL